MSHVGRSTHFPNLTACVVTGWACVVTGWKTKRSSVLFGMKTIWGRCWKFQGSRWGSIHLATNNVVVLRVGSFRTLSILLWFHSTRFILFPTLFNEISNFSVVLFPVFLIETSCLVIRGGIWIWITKEWLDRSEDRGDVVRGTPLILEYVQADWSVCINIRVEHFRGETNFGCFVWIFFREF